MFVILPFEFVSSLIHGLLILSFVEYNSEVISLSVFISDDKGRTLEMVSS